MFVYTAEHAIVFMILGGFAVVFAGLFAIACVQAAITQIRKIFRPWP